MEIVPVLYCPYGKRVPALQDAFMEWAQYI